jgi:hypothetical protein
MFAALLATAADAQPRANVVEFYNGAHDHYFVTSSAQEMADLDSGVHPGWQRTGLSFSAYDTGGTGANPVCRFYIPPELGDSHFYSASPAECAQTHARFPDFTLESSDVFGIGLPDAVTGACGSDSIPVYRLWNGRSDTNHRYTTDRVVWQHMRDLGWVAEGYGDAQVIMCSPAAPINNVDVTVGGRAVIKARAAGGVVALLEERLNSIFETGPDRILAVVGADGHGTRIYTPPAGWAIADFAVHPSGDVSLVLTTATSVRLVRLDRDARLRDDEIFADPAAATDPFFNFAPGPKNDDALQPVLMHDAARVVPLGEGLILVLRTGRNAVVAYRLDPDASAAYRRTWRTLVEPGSSIAGVFLKNGSFDTFGQLQNHVEVHVDVDANGTLAIATVESPFRSFVFEAHAAYFGEPIAAPMGVLVSRIATSDGRRLGSSAIDTHQTAELHGLRSAGNGFALVGRVSTEVNGDGSGWDAFIARVRGDGNVATYKVVDVNAGDILFDVAALASGRYLALGTTGYFQNPTGASISEDTEPLLLVLEADGSVAARVNLGDGPRQDQLRTIDSLGGRWLVGGMRNGPGTHSGDFDRSLIAADGFLMEMTGLPTQ